MKIDNGMVVTMHYTLTDDTGAVLDSSREGNPLAYLHGHGNIIPGLEKTLTGAEVGHRANVTVAPTEGYGEKNPDAVFSAPREHFPGDMALEPGLQLQVQGPQGPMRLTVIEVEEENVILDANHPLAGKTLHFDVEVVGIRKATDEEMDHGHVHDGHHHH